MAVRPTLITANFPSPVYKPEEMPRWTADFRREMDALLYRLDLLFRNSGGISPTNVNSGGAIAGGGIPPFTTNTDTLDGYHAADIISVTRANGNYPFADPLAGPVWPGEVNGSFHRLRINDGIFGIEPEGTARAGDIRLTATFRPGVFGRYQGQRYHFIIDDTDTNSPNIGIRQVSAFSSPSDFWFQQNLGFVLRDRANSNSWLIFVDDTDLAGVIGLELYGFIP